MGLLIRKIDGPKWKRCDYAKGVDAVPADLITKDLQTNSNTLSLWYADSESCIDDVILALASRRNAINIIDIIKIERESVKEDLELTPSEGSTAYVTYKDKHYNLINLTYNSIGLFAALILENKNAVERIKVQRIKSILKNGLAAKKIRQEDLDPHILPSLGL
jgi:hypothetical protein